MNPLKVYLDTSVINFLFADDAPELMNATVEFFDSFVARKVYDVFISDVVIQEINQTTDPEKKSKLLNAVARYALKKLPLNVEIAQLIRKYLEAGALAANKQFDALHVALGTVNNIDVLASWNFKHLANVNRRQRIRIINEREGYFYPIDITTPLALLNNEQ